MDNNQQRLVIRNIIVQAKNGNLSPTTMGVYWFTQDMVNMLDKVYELSNKLRVSKINDLSRVRIKSEIVLFGEDILLLHSGTSIKFIEKRNADKLERELKQKAKAKLAKAKSKLKDK